MNKFIIAAVQMNTQDNKQDNLRKAQEFVEEAAAKGASLVVFPESMDYIGPGGSKYAEYIPEGECFRLFAELAKKHNLWIHSGSIREICDGDPRPYNSSFVVSPQGDLSAIYRKIHLFNVDVKEGPAVRESDKVSCGNDLVLLDTGDDGVGKLGLSICYDMRFAELYRILALHGANILLVPSYFNLITGKDHWEPLLRTRAIENGCYVVAPDQIGNKPQMMPAYGNTMIIDPWGMVIARASNKECIITAEIDLDYVESVRKQTYTLSNRRTDLYEIKEL